MDLKLPDGTPVRGSSLAERDADDPRRDFGLYLDPSWAPTWPAELIDWPDRGVPADRQAAAAQIAAALARARAGQLVEVGCMGGLGRTGTALACMTVLCGLDPADAVAWVRSNYRPAAVETPAQEAWVAWFAAAARLPDPGVPPRPA